MIGKTFRETDFVISDKQKDKMELRLNKLKQALNENIAFVKNSFTPT